MDRKLVLTGEGLTDEITQKLLSALVTGLKKGKAVREYNDIEYARFRETMAGIERGTVIAKGRVVRGFPQIKRIFTLKNGLARNMDGVDTIHAEEKIDGFNVRVASINGEIFAFSRGGFLEPFVTEKAREMKLERFFRDNPFHTLCGEMIGNTPFTAPTSEFDVRLFIFDIDRGYGDYMPPAERYELLEKYGILSVPRLGTFKPDDIDGLRKLVLSLNKGKREGMVLKSADRKKAVKYVTPNADIEDIANTSRMIFDMPIGFYYQRVLRSAFFMDDFSLDREEHAKRLGKAFYEGLTGAIRLGRGGKEIDEEFEILIRDPKVWDAVRHHISRDVGVEELWKREEKDGRLRIRFRKIYKRTTKLLTSYANGKGVTD